MRSLRPDNPLLSGLVDGFIHCMADVSLLERCRDEMRVELTKCSAAAFPRFGHNMAAVTHVIQILFSAGSSYGYGVGCCHACTAQTPKTQDNLQCPLWSLNSFSLLNECFGGRNSISTQEFVNEVILGQAAPCAACRGPVRIALTLSVAPPLLFLQVPQNRTLDPVMDVFIVVKDVKQHWCLLAITYFGFGHFTCRYQAPDRTWWYHDGATTKRMCRRENRFSNTAALQSSRSRMAEVYIYRLCN